MAPVARNAALPLLLAALLLAVAAPAAAQHLLEGRVVDDRTGEAVPGALVRLLAADGAFRVSVSADRAGAFSLRVLPGADHVVVVEALGYVTVEVPAPEADGRSVVPVVVRLGVDAVPVDPLVVTAETGAASTFERRRAWGRASGRGVFLTRDDLEAAGAGARISTILRRVPGVPLAQTLDGETVLGVSAREGSRHTYEAACQPRLLLDGLELQQGRVLDEVVTPDQLEGVEVYRHAAETPSELDGFRTCGAVVLWTRRGEPRTGSSSFWRNVVGGVLAAGITALLVF